MFKFIISMLSMNILFGTSQFNLINTNQDFLDTSKTIEVVELIKQNISDEDISDKFINKVESAKSINELDNIIKEVDNFIKNSDSESLDSNNEESIVDHNKDIDDVIKPSEYTEDIKTDDTGLLVFLDDESEAINSMYNNDDISDNDTKNINKANISNHKSISILTDDKDINVLEYRTIKSIDGVYDLYGKLEDIKESDAVLVIINLNFDTVEILSILNSIPNNIKDIYITSNSKYIVDSVSILENSSNRIHFIEYDDLVSDL